MIEKIEEFLRKYYEEELFTAVREGRDSIIVDYTELDKFDYELAEALLNNPKDFFENAKEAVENIDLPSETEGTMRLRIKDLPEDEKVRIKDLRSKHLGKFIKIEGTVRRASEVMPELEVAIFECPDCGERISVPQARKRMSYPSSCSCGRKRGFKQVDRTLSDSRWIAMEDLFEEVSGEKPGEVNVYLKDDLTVPRMQRKTDPGARLEITGIVREMPKRVRGKKTKKLDIFIEANHVQAKEVEFEELEISDEDKERIKELASDDKIYQKLINSLAPSMHGMDEIKESIALQLFGGVPHKLADGTKVRGDIHILLVGDPGTGKTQIMKMVSDLIPRGRYVSGKGTSAAGLTASVVRDEEFMGGWVLEAGALVLSNKSLIAIDEFDKMSKEDQVNLHEAMSTQSYHPDFKLQLADGSSRKIGDLVDELMNKHEEKIVDGIDCEMLKLPEGEGIQLVSTDFSSVYSKKPTRLSRHEAPDKFYTINTSSGRSVKVTPEHPIWIIEDGEIKTKRADQIEGGEWIPVPLSMPIIGEEQDLEEMEEFHPNSKEIEIPTHNSPELCSLVGYMVSDCGYEMNRGKKNGINFTNSDERLLEDFRNKMKKLFGMEAYERVRNDRGDERTTLRYVSSRLRDFFQKLGDNLLAKHDRKEIPNKIMKCHRKELKYLLQSAFAGDGGIVSKDRGQEIIYTTSSERLANQISDLLLRFSITSKIRTSRSEAGKKIYRVTITYNEDILKFRDRIGFFTEELNQRVDEYLSEKKSLRRNLFGAVPEVGDLVIDILDDLNISQDKLVGWTLTEYKDNNLHLTRKTLERILPEIEERYLELQNTLEKIPENGKDLRELRRKFGVEVDDIADDLDITNSSLYYREDNSTLLEDYREILEEKMKEKLFVRNKIEFLKHLVEGQIGWVQVDSVETKKSDCDMVYDVTVPGETFISNGMVLHNTISISKASIQATLPARTSVIGGANPKLSRFDPYRPINEQIDIPQTILSRFDIRFTLRDVPDREEDEKLVSHIIEGRVGEEGIEPVIDPDFLKKYVAYARESCYPEMTEKAASILKNFYVNMRNKYTEDDSNSVPLSLRQYEALLRLSEASAKIKLKDEVSKEDAQRAIRLMKESLRQLGMDPETGNIDIDRAEGGTPGSQRSKIRVVMDLMDELEDEMGKNIPMEDLVAALEEEGLSNADKIIREMKQKGMIFEPRPGHIQKI
ncbi:MAG: LAGLIDADG family homing endonuclease [Candidatus Aenigmatarchaeota archaeon]